MPWGDEQERLTQEARLSVASPEEVIRELRLKAHGTRFARDEAMEALLVERNDPLINLELACYGTSQEVFTALYKHGLEEPIDTADERYKRGLRIGCLSNPYVYRPGRLIGSDEVHRIIATGEDAEAEALICNPSVSDRLLEELYTPLVYFSHKNEHLGTNKDSDGHMSGPALIAQYSGCSK
jgi:hypothetical protein